MTIVRELLVNFGAKLDSGDMKKIDGQVKGIAAVAKAALGGAFLIKTGQALFALNELASDVEENMNVINQSFGDGAQGALDWAEDFGNAAGRNRYEMEQLVGTMGSLLNPMMDGSEEKAAEMSTTMAELAVDLASFFNTADGASINALRGGLSGEAEPLKKFGIVMNEAALEAFALEEGIKGSVKSMDIAEKTALRYNFILSKTSSAQGDAVRTALGWANAKKAVIGKLTELATTVGLKLLPGMGKLAFVARKTIEWFMGLIKGTKFIEAALITLGAVATAVGIKLFIAFWPVILPLLKIGALFTLITLLVEDFLVFLEGGDSVIGAFIDSIFGPGSASEALYWLSDAFDALKQLWHEEIIPGLDALSTALAEFFIWLEPIAAHFFGFIGDRITEMVNAIKDAIDYWTGDGIDALKSFGSDVADVWENISGFTGAVANLDLEAFGMQNETTGNAARPTWAGGTAPSSRGKKVSITENNTTNVHVAGNATAETAGKIATKTSDSQRNLNKRTLAAVQRGGA